MYIVYMYVYVYVYNVYVHVCVYVYVFARAQNTGNSGRIAVAPQALTSEARSS